jgi:hypothetical protein
MLAPVSEHHRRDRRRSRDRLTVGRGGGRRVVTLETIKQQTEQAASRAAVRVRDPRRGRV